MHEMKNEREREKGKVGGEISARNAWNEKRERERERERNEKWMVKFLLEIHEMKREREMKIGGKIPASLE
jgi:hypothetical protein